MKKILILFMLAISVLLASCASSEDAESGENSPGAASAIMSEEESSEEVSEPSEEPSEEESEDEESEEPSEAPVIPDDASELYVYAMKLIEESESYTSMTEATYDLFQSNEPEPVLSYTASTKVRIQEVNEHDKRLDFTTVLSIDGIESESRLFYIDSVAYYDTDGEKTKQQMSFEKVLEFLGTDGESFSFTPDMFGSINCDDLRGGKRIELTDIKDIEAASSLVPDNMENGKIEDLRVTLYVNDDGTPAAEIIGMRMKVESDHKIDIYCEIIQTTAFSDIGSTVIKSDINPNDYTDGIIYRD